MKRKFNLNLKPISYLLVGILLGSLIPIQSTLATNPIKIIVNDKEIQCNDVPPQNISGRIMVPLRTIAQALGATVGWDQDNNAVIISSTQQQLNNTLTEKTSNTSTPTPKKVELPTLALGEKASIDGLEIKVERIEYGTPNYPGQEKGFRIYFSVTNNSSKPIDKAGEFSFTLKEPKYETEVNRLGYGHHVDNEGSVYPGESASGYYEWYYDQDIQLSSIIYYIPASGSHRNPVATWNIQ